MQKRRLGADGPAVSAVGLGAMSFAGFYGPVSEAQSHEVLRTALELGIDHLDTSNVYGEGVSERVIGRFLAQRKGEPAFHLATKAGIKRNPDTGTNSFDNRRAHLEAELDGSLKRLGVERIDLFYVHRRDPQLPIEEVTETLAGFIKAGKIGSFGFSEIAPSSLRRAAAVHPVAAVQSEYSLATRAPELGLVQACAELGAALVAFSPVGRGLLTDSPPTNDSIEVSAFLKTNPRFEEPNLTYNLRKAGEFRQLAAELCTSTAALAIAWLLHQSPGVIPIPGTRAGGHLHELAAGAKLTLSAADLRRIEVCLPVGWAHGDRYSVKQWVGPECFS